MQVLRYLNLLVGKIGLEDLRGAAAVSLIYGQAGSTPPECLQRRRGSKEMIEADGLQENCQTDFG